MIEIPDKIHANYHRGDWSATQGGLYGYDHVYIKASLVKELLKGIDEQELDGGDGWWETSTGAEFGAGILNKLGIGELNE